MSASSMMSRGRVIAEELMVDTVTVTRPGTATFNPTTGLITAGAGTPIYTGPGRLRQPSATESEVMFGEQQVALSRFIACLPHDATGIQVDDIVTVTESDDADIAGVGFRVAMVPLATFTLYKGFPCEAVE